MTNILGPQLNRAAKHACALAAAALFIPTLAYAGDGRDKDDDRGDRRGDNDHHWRGDDDDHGRSDNDRDGDDRKVSVVPEVSAGWVLIPLFGAVLLFSSLPLLRREADKKDFTG